jgi:hypothetical protein
MPLSWNEIRSRAITFSKEWEDESSESAEAKTFWDQFFEVFGVPRRRLATFETHVQKAGEKAGFIDLFWPGVLIAEHKSRGKNLKRAFTQAIDYFPGLKDADLPRYVVVSDFARFRIHDLETGDETEFPLADLHQHVQTFGFIAGYEARKFKEQDPVNIKAAERLAALHDGLKDIGYDGHDLEVYLVRLLFCMFAEDTGIFLPRGCFQDFIEQRTSADGSDLAARLSELFDVLNTPTERRLKNRDEQIAQFPFVNGKLFEQRLRTAAFDARLRRILLECCELDWGQVSPAIFGSLFQAIMDKDARRSLGAHYTSEQNIMKVIGPLFLDDLRTEFERLKQDRSTQRIARLTKFHDRLAQLNFLDPACGCGNFLVIAYRELRQLELEILRELYRKPGGVQLELDAIGAHVKIDVDQFHGIEIEEWPAQIAQVAMWLMDHQMNIAVSKEFGDAFVRIPLTKSANIVHGNALEIDWNTVLPAASCSFVLGNPPFSGAMVMGDEQRANQRAVLGSLPGSGVIDFVACWFWISAQYIQGSQIRVGLVATNSLCQGEQVGLFWRPTIETFGVHILFAHRTFKWKSEARGMAAVHCVIVGFGVEDVASKTLFDYEDASGEPHATPATNINAYLVDAPNIFIVNRGKPISDVPPMRFGSMPRDGGNLILTDEECGELITQQPEARKWLKRYTGAKEFLNGGMRWCLWLVDISPAQLRAMPHVLSRVKRVRQFRLNSKAAATQNFAATPTVFCQIAQPKTSYLLVPGVTSQRRPFIPIGFMPPDVVASNLVFVVPDASLLHFGVVSSSMHMAWTKAVCGRLKSDFRYSKDLVYNNFIWPTATAAQVRQIESSAQQILDARALHSDATLADLYDPLAMPDNLRKAHRENDRAVDAAYGRRKFATEAERVGFLFELYEQLAASGTS